jgi:hypothetical protein
MILTAIPGISAKLKQIIEDVAAGTSALLSSNVITHPTASTILAAWNGVIAALQNDPALPATSLAPIQQLGKAVQAALLQDELAARLVDWTTIRTMGLVPVPPALPPAAPPPIAPVPANG